MQSVGMFKLAEGGSNLPGPVLRDATPRQIGARPAPAAPAPAKLAKPARQIPPPHLSDDEEAWEEF